MFFIVIISLQLIRVSIQVTIKNVHTHNGQQTKERKKKTNVTKFLTVHLRLEILSLNTRIQTNTPSINILMYSKIIIPKKVNILTKYESNKRKCVVSALTVAIYGMSKIYTNTKHRNEFYMRDTHASHMQLIESHFYLLPIIV